MSASDASSPDSTTNQSRDDGSPVADASEQARDRLEKHYRDLEETYDDTRVRIENLNDRAADFIRDNPGVCIVGAVAAGYVIGRLASRRWLT